MVSHYHGIFAASNRRLGSFMSTRSEKTRSQLVAMMPRLRRFALSLAAKRDDADDLVQAALVRALSQEGAMQNVERLDSWMYRVIQNLWIDERRRRSTRGTEVLIDDLANDVGDDGRAYTEVRSDLVRAQKAFDRMKPEIRASAVLVIVNEVSYREAAEILDVPIGTVMSRVSRARQALAECISGTTAEAVSTQ
jgi:RNA polymerase sigma-70 factor (ECF subfamily)